MYLLDTNVVSELRKPRPHGAVVAWIAAKRPDQLFVASMTLAGIQAGIEMTREQDTAKAAAIEAWLDAIAASFAVLPADARVFRAWARLMHRKPDDVLEDALIAATALVHDLTVVTRNVRDFAAFGVRLENPFAPAR